MNAVSRLKRKRFPAVDAAMTINRIVHEFPSTKPVFDRFSINVPLEGCTCLDEVAWRHGMEAEELLRRLEAVIASCGCAGHESGQPAVTLSVEVGAIGENN